MRIAYLPGRFPMLSETPVLNQITGLVARGHDVDIFCDRPGPPAPYHESIDRYSLLERASYPDRIPSGFFPRWSGVFRLLAGAPPESRTVLRRTLNPLVYAGRALSGKLAYHAAAYLPPRTYDIIHGGFGEQGIKALRMRRLGAIRGRVVTAFQGADITKYVRIRGPRVYRRLWREGDLFLPVSAYFGRRLETLGCPPERTTVLRTGIDLSLFAYRPRTPSRPLRLVTVGRLVEKKGIPDALRMMALLEAAGIEVSYDLIGDGPLRNSLEGLARELGVAPRVRFLGEQDQTTLPRLLDAAHILLTPSVLAADGDQEGIPNVIKEGMALGLAIVSTYHAGIPELVENGVHGYLAPERDPEALAAAVRQWHEHPDAWPRILDAARRRVEDDYDIEKQNDRLVELYEDVLQQTVTRSSSSTVL